MHLFKRSVDVAGSIAQRGGIDQSANPGHVLEGACRIGCDLSLATRQTAADADIAG